MDTIEKNNQKRALHTSTKDVPLIIVDHIRAAVKRKLKMEVNLGTLY